MKYFVGIILIALGLFHGLHVLSVEVGSVTNLNGSRFLSFAALDRFASSGMFGKVVVLLIDLFVVFLGALEIIGRSIFSFFSQKRKPPLT